MLTALFVALAARPAQEASRPPRGAHAAQAAELGERLGRLTDDERALSSPGAAATSRPALTTAMRGRPDLAPRAVVFGYLQSEVQVPHLRWQALTHVGSRFVSFDANGDLVGASAFTARSSALTAGGAADAAGVKVILVLNQFDDAPSGVLATVMTSPARRAHLAAEVAQLLAADGYSHGVNLDFEFSWGPAVRDGITAFCAELRAALDAVDPGLELSVYVGAIHSAGQWDLDPTTGITPLVDHVLYSMYDWATGLTAHAISDFDATLGPTRLHGYLDAGLPPEKLVLVLSTYSRRWSGTSVYNGVGTSSASSGFTDALFDVTLNPAAGGPFQNRHVSGDEAGWYAWSTGGLFTRTWESPEALEVELRHALSLRDAAGRWNGRRAAGVGFWSLFWLAETSSIDPRTGLAVSRTRTYPHVYRACQDVFRAPGDARVLAGFEGLDPRWRDPNESPDTRGDLDGDSTRALVARPGGAGAPARGGPNALAFGVDLEVAGRAVLAHELLASPLAPLVVDVNAALAHVARDARLAVHVRPAAPLPGATLRLLVLDRDLELESSPPLALDTAAWRELGWALNDPAGVTGQPTDEPLFQDGDGVLDTAGGGARDLCVYGFLVESPGPAAGTVVLDELTVAPRAPGGRRYRLNELRYADPAAEFVEVHGPAGPLPVGLALVAYDRATGGVLGERPLTGAIPDDGGGRGFLVLGDPGVPNVDLGAGFSSTRRDLPDVDPSALQLVDTARGFVHDSLVYEAWGGLDELVRVQARGVTATGPWLGQAAGGTDTQGAGYSVGRFPDGATRGANGVDFSFQRASPGASNGGALALPAAFDFGTAPAALFQTFDAPRFVDPRAAGLPASPGGGPAWRCVDVAGGGVIGVVGDAALGTRGGFEVSLDLYLPRADAPPQAVAAGVLGRQGSNFFTSTATDRSGYESGLWLIHENRPGVGLADGRPDHPGVLELVLATHDNQDGERVSLLAARSLADLGVGPGSWARVRFRVEPFSRGDALVVSVAGSEVHRGPLPADAPRAGAVQVGFRENHPGAPLAGEGAWVDDLTITPVAGPAAPRPTR